MSCPAVVGQAGLPGAGRIDSRIRAALDKRIQGVCPQFQEVGSITGKST